MCIIIIVTFQLYTYTVYTSSMASSVSYITIVIYCAEEITDYYKKHILTLILFFLGLILTIKPCVFCTYMLALICSFAFAVAFLLYQQILWKNRLIPKCNKCQVVAKNIMAEIVKFIRNFYFENV